MIYYNKEMKKNFLLFLFFLILISCKNKTESSKDNLNPQFNMTSSEMDKLMSCSMIMILKTQKDRDEIKNTMEKFNSTFQEKVQAKLFSDMFEKCVDNIKEDTYSKIIKDLVVIAEPDFTNDIEKLVDIDYSKYNENSNLEFSMKQMILSYKFQKVKTLFQEKRNNPQQEGNENYKTNIYDITKIPNFVRIILFIFVFALLFIGTFYALKKLTYKPEKKKKKKN